MQTACNRLKLGGSVTLEIREVPVMKIVDDPDFMALVQSNWEECANKAMGTAQPDRAQ